MANEPTETWRACEACGWRARMAFYNPSTVYCEGCGTKIGKTDQPVESDLAALDGDVIIHAESGRELASVRWDERRVRFHTGE